MSSKLSAFNTETERRLFTANYNWFLSSKGLSQKRVCEETGLPAYQASDATRGHVSPATAEKIARWMGYSPAELMARKLSQEIKAADPRSTPPEKRRAGFVRKPGNGNGAKSSPVLRVSGLTFSLRSGKPQLFELGDIKFVIEGKTGQAVRMDIDIEG